MLTKDDFSKLKKIIRDEITVEAENTRESLDSEIRTSRITIQSDIRTLGSRTKNIEIRTMNLEKSNQQILKAFRKLRKDLSGTINMADHGLINLEKRIRTVEQQLNIPEPQII